MHIYSPYTYHIAWTSIDKHYYGVRYAKGCNPNDLWSSYFTSSKEVKKYRELYGEPDVIEVRKVFTDAYSAKSWECRVLRKLNVLRSYRWLNANIGGEQFIIEKHSEETKRKMSENNGSKRFDARAAISERQTGAKNSFFGKHHTKETKNKMRESLTGIQRSEEFKEARRGDNNPSKRSDVKSKISERVAAARANAPLISCTLCRRTFKGPTPYGVHKRLCR